MDQSHKNTPDQIVAQRQTDEFYRLLAAYIHQVQSKSGGTAPKWNREIAATLKTMYPRK